MGGPGSPPVDEHEVAWRFISQADGSIILLHQQASTAIVSTSPEGYGGMGCGAGIAHPALTVFASGSASSPIAFGFGGTLAVDLALSPDSTTVAIALPGNTLGRADQPGVAYYPRGLIESGSPMPCAAPPPRTTPTSGVPVAIAYAPDGRLFIQNREPAVLDIVDAVGTVGHLQLSATSRADSGHVLFHGNAGANIACASCHPEGGEDGHTWFFDTFGARRTQAIRGGILPTAPFHWSGDMTTFGDLAHAVLGTRMGAGDFAPAYADVLAQYVDHLPALAQPTPPDAAAVDRGRALFEDPTVGCTSCHTGVLLTNNATVDVGTGGMFQVPSLRGIRWRAPYMHNGCAATLRDRFDATCGGGESHGHTAALASSQLDDLVAYLVTL
jgi:hypothetical protein